MFQNVTRIPRNDFTLPLTGGRLLGGTRFGAPNSARTVVYLHGFPGSRIESELGARAALERGISIVAFDRPGMGSSTRAEHRTVEGYVQDLEEALAHLGIDRFYVLGVSGGAPYTLAALRHFKVRIKKAAIVSGMVAGADEDLLRTMHWVNRTVLRIGRKNEERGKRLVRRLADSWRKYPLMAGGWFMFILPRPDLRVVTRPWVSRILRENLAESLKQGPDGAVDEYLLLLRPFETPVEGNQVPVKLWHGARDTYVPQRLAEHIVRNVPGSSLEMIPHGGHFMIVDIVDDVLDWLISE